MTRPAFGGNTIATIAIRKQAISPEACEIDVAIPSQKLSGGIYPPRDQLLDFD